MVWNFYRLPQNFGYNQIADCHGSRVRLEFCVRIAVSWSATFVWAILWICHFKEVDMAALINIWVFIGANLLPLPVVVTLQQHSD